VLRLSLWLAPLNRAWYNVLMQELVARDFENARLTPDQIRKINYAIDQVDMGRYSFQYLKELVELGRKSLKKAYAEGKDERAADLVAEVQIYNHVLNICYDKKGTVVKNVKPDPKHLKVLAIVDGRVCPVDYTMDTWVNLLGGNVSRGPAWDILKHYGENCAACNKVVANIDPKLVGEKIPPEVAKFVARRFPQAQVVTKFQPAEQPAAEKEAGGGVGFLSEDIRKDVEPLSSNPQVAAAQTKVRKLIDELLFATEDREPPFIITKIQSKLATAHEQLVTLRQQVETKRSSRR